MGGPSATLMGRSASRSAMRPKCGRLRCHTTILKAAVRTLPGRVDAFVKLPHHGSYNGADAGLLDEWQAKAVAVGTARDIRRILPSNESRARGKYLIENATDDKSEDG